MALNSNMLKFMFMLCFIIAFVSTYGVSADDTDNETENSTVLTVSSPVTTTLKPNTSCEIHKNDCDACVRNTKCYFCWSTKGCHYHVEKDIAGGKCEVNDIYYLTCRAKLKFLVIGLSVVAGIVVLIMLIICCYCCCKKKGVKVSKDDIKWARQREERKQIAAERRKERAERTEEIKKKYGLVKDSNPYQKFDA